jgi:type I restriction enzyme S subunit
MTHGIPTYPAMRSSGVHWLGAVPSHWERRRLKSLLRPIDRRSTTGAETLLSLRRDHGIVVYSEHFSRPAQGATTVGYKIVTKGQLVVNRLQANNGLVFDSSLDGLVSPDYSVFESQNSASIVMPYLSLLLRTQIYRDHFRRESTGLGTGSAGFLRLYDDRFLETPVVVPPADEQASILRFMDHADRRIRRYIRAKQKLIKLLEEQKRTIVHHAVTRGLDMRVRVKPSGIDWIGDVPEHWEIWKVGHFASVGNGSTPSRGNAAYWSGGAFPWLNSSSVNAGIITVSDQFVTETALRECHLPRVQPGSVLVAITGQGKTRGTAAVLAIEATINQHIAFIAPRRQKKTATPEYLRVFLVAAYSELRRISEDSGSTKGALTCEDLKHFRVLLPPADEQNRIVSIAREKTARVETHLRGVEREISLLREYRTRLIADVVTGKLDVRDAAARLPEDGSDTEPLDEADAEVEGEGSEEQVEAVVEEAGA